MSKLSKVFEIDGVKTDMTSVVLSDPTAAYGVKRDDTDAVVVADGTAMDHDGVGLYSYTFADPAVDLTYTYWLEFVYDGETHWIEGSLAGPTATLSAYALTTLANANEYCGSSGVDSFITRLINAASVAIEKECQRQFVSRDYTSWLDGTGTEFLPLANYPITALTRCSVGWRDAIHVENTRTEAQAFAAMARVSSTAVICTLMDSTTTVNTLLFATYATITTMVAAINALGNGWSATVRGDYGALASAQLRPHGGKGCLGTDVSLEFADLPESNIEIDQEAHALIHPSVWRAGYQNVFVAYTGGYATVPDDLEQVCLAVVKEVYGESQTDGAMQSETLGDYKYVLKATDDVIKRHLARLGPWRRIAF